jgi:hypothetical protein
MTAIFAAALLAGSGWSTQAKVTGQWDFDNGDLRATVGQALEYFDFPGGDTEFQSRFGTTTALGVPDIDGQPAQVMHFPTASSTMGYVMHHGVESNGDFGGEHYTLIFDVLYPPSSDDKWRAFIQIDDPFNGNDSELFVNPAGGIGISGQYHGKILPNTWHRVAFVKEGGTLRKYIDGVKVGEQSVGGVRWVLDPAPFGTALIFTDNDGEAFEGYVNSVQVRDVPLTDLDLARLGTAKAAGIPQVIPDVSVAPSITAQPLSQVASAGASVTFTVTVVGTAPFEYQWRRGGENLSGQTQATLVLNNIRAGDAGEYDVVVKNAAGEITSQAARLGVFAGPITQDLVLHLPFDNDSQDASGRNNHGARVGQEEVFGDLPLFVGGGQQRMGSHALNIREGQHVTLGRPSDLQFGADVNFTLSFWVKGDAGAWSSDPAFISNKAWQSGSNQGFVVSAQGNGGWKWNYKGSNASRRDTPNISVLTDGEWHHILVIHDRTSVASFYLDGELVNTQPIAGDGDVDALDMNIGNDGTGRYGFNNDFAARFNDMLMDDVGIWRRSLTPQEITAIYEGGLEGKSLSEISAGTAPTEVIGQWDFNEGDLKATVGQALEYRGDIQAGTTFSEMQINNETAKVLCYPGATPSQGYIMRHNSPGNGGGANLNQYTLVMDVWFPQESHGRWRAFLQTDPENVNDGDLFVNAGNGIGISGQYQGEILPETWHRVAFAFDLTASTVGKYIDGTLVNLQTLSATSGGVDQRWSLLQSALLFTDEDNETAPGCVGSIQLRNVRLSDMEIASLGKASAAGIPQEITVILVPPQFAEQPKSQLVSPGVNVSFSVRTVGTEPFTYQWRKNGEDLIGETMPTLNLSGVQTGDIGEYDVVVRNAAGTETSATARLGIFSGAITQDLVVHLPFDNDTQDASGRNNHGTGEGQPEFDWTPPGFVTGGKIGSHAIRLGTGQHVNLGQPDDLKFGSDVDFSIAFWVKGEAEAWTSDPAFIANKNWASGGNQGFIVAAQSNGGWKGNFKGAIGPRSDTSNLGVIRDGEWHHILVSHNRQGLASYYHNGQLMATLEMAGAGDIDALELNIGNDGTGRYGFDNDTGARFSEIFMDDLGIWRRTLTPQEAGAIYAAGQGGNNLTTATLGGSEIAISSVVRDGNNITITWTGAPGVALQTTVNLENANWQDVSGTAGASSSTQTVTGNSAFFRLIQR